MQVGDVMTRRVYTVTRETTIGELAQLLASHNISGAPVTEPEEKIVGIVTEGDLLRRVEIGTDRARRSWVRRLFEMPDDLAAEFVKTHARYVREIMNTDVVIVSETTDLADLADIFERRRIKRTPVVRDGKLIGIASRRDLVRELARRITARSDQPMRDDREIASQFQQVLKGQPWAAINFVNFEVKDGVVDLRGLVESEEQRRALRVAAESIAGVRQIEDHLTVRPAYLAAK